MLDIFGRIRYSQELDDTPVPYETDSETTVTKEGNIETTTVITYLRYYDTGTNKCGIQKHTRVLNVDTTTNNSDETIKIEFAYDLWGNRETATYKPINECWGMHKDNA